MNVKIHRLALDCKTGKTEYLSSLLFCSSFMTHLQRILGVTEIGRTQHKIGTPVWSDKKAGISISVVFIESGASIHTWPEYGEFYLDINSCKYFDHEKIIRLVKRLFAAEIINTHKF